VDVTSTVLDAAVCLLLVSAAALAVVAPGQTGFDGGGGGPPAERPGDRAARADHVASTLTGSTASVNYSLATGAREANGTAVAFPRTSGPAFERHDHGTLAGLLATAAVGDLTVRQRPLTHTHDGLVRVVRGAVEPALDGRAHVVASWRPYPGAHLRGRVTVGQRPPPDSTVHAATVTLPSGLSSTRTAARAASEQGFDGVAAAVARRLVTGLFPPRQGRFALRGDYPVSALVEHRYRRAGRRYHVDLSAALERHDTTTANARLAAAMAPAVERDLRREYESPEVAARAVRTDQVSLVVRTWSP
jgi:hypothetical protein